MTDKKLYVVTFSMDMVVAAKSVEEAKAIARRDMDAEVEAGLDVDSVEEMSVLPNALWALDSIPYGQPEMSIEAWINAGAAPKYVETREKLQAAYERAKSAGLLTRPST